MGKTVRQHKIFIAKTWVKQRKKVFRKKNNNARVEVTKLDRHDSLAIKRRTLGHFARECATDEQDARGHGR